MCSGLGETLLHQLYLAQAVIKFCRPRKLAAFPPSDSVLPQIVQLIEEEMASIDIITV